MSMQDITNWLAVILRVFDDVVFKHAPLIFDRYLLEAPWPLLAAGVVLFGAAVVYLTLLPTRDGDTTNVGIVMAFNAVGRAATGLCVLAFYGSIVALFAIAIMRMLP